MERTIVRLGVSEAQMPAVAMEKAAVWTARRMRQQRKSHTDDRIGALLAASIHFGPSFPRNQHVHLEIAIRVANGALGGKRCTEIVESGFGHVVWTEAGG